MRLVFVLTAVSGLWIGCGKRPVTVNEVPIGKTVRIVAPLGLPQVPTPVDNPPTEETIALGRRLFHDRQLSAGGKLSCASCHNPMTGFSDGLRFSTGVAGKFGTRNAPTILNAVYAGSQFWDGRASSLEEQALGPIANPIEMNQSHDVSVSKLNQNASYVAEFTRAFGPGPITIGKVQKALASFERTILSGNSAFDQYQYGGDRRALSPSAIRGLAVFQDSKKGNCSTCHTIGREHALFFDGKFHNIGVGVNPEGELTDVGRFGLTKSQTDKGAFKTPSLRDVALTAPYMHDGSLKTLRAVVDFYVGGANWNPNLDTEIKSLDLTRTERDDLVAFLASLTGEKLTK